MNNLARFATAAAASLALLAPLGASAMTAPAPQSYTLNSRIVDRNHGGELDGRLQIRISPEGIVQGTYLPQSGGGFVPVTGGVDGKTIWLDFGMMGRLHLEGTIDNGRITASTGNGFDTWTLEAAPVS